MEPLGKFLLVKSAAAEEVTKATDDPVPNWSWIRHGNFSSQSGDSNILVHIMYIYIYIQLITVYKHIIYVYIYI